jgi:hypothetical protein
MSEFRKKKLGQINRWGDRPLHYRPQEQQADVDMAKWPQVRARLLKDLREGLNSHLSYEHR